MQPPILRKSIEKLEISGELKAFMIQHEMIRLETLLQIKGSALLKMEGFSYRMLHSLLSFLERHDCLNAFKDC